LLARTFVLFLPLVDRCAELVPIDSPPIIDRRSELLTSISAPFVDRRASLIASVFPPLIDRHAELITIDLPPIIDRSADPVSIDPSPLLDRHADAKATCEEGRMEFASKPATAPPRNDTIRPPRAAATRGLTPTGSIPVRGPSMSR